MSYQGILVDVDFCTGCEACVLACQQEHGYSEKETGLKITKLGPLKFGEKDWQYDFIPQFTRWCDLCEDRRAKGKPATCEPHCPAQVIEVGKGADLATKVSREKMMLVAIKEA